MADYAVIRYADGPYRVYGNRNSVIGHLKAGDKLLDSDVAWVGDDYRQAQDAAREANRPAEPLFEERDSE